LIELDYTVDSLEDLDEFQEFYSENGLSMVIRVVEGSYMYEDGYLCELLESNGESLLTEGDYFILKVGDKISFSE
jgi:hypothetical protein